MQGRTTVYMDGFRNLLDSGALSDVTLTVTDTPRAFRAHRAILAAQSPIFQAMFEAPMAERNMAAIAVPFKESCLEGFLRYVYCCDVQAVRHGNATDVMDAAMFYQVRGLSEACIDFLKTNTTNDTVCGTLECALKYDIVGLREHCVAFVRQNNTDVISSPDLARVPADVLLLLLTEAVIDSDITILKRCHAWAVANCQCDPPTPEAVALLLKPFLVTIDFTAMSPADIAEVEEKDLVPLRYLYEAFKKGVLGIPSDVVPRRGGIPLQWDNGPGTTLRIDNNDVSWDTVPTSPPRGDHMETVVTLNKFSRGRHYWTVVVSDVAQAGDAIVGVGRSRTDPVVGFDAFSATVHTVFPVERHQPTNDFLLLRHEGCGAVGFHLDFDARHLLVYDHAAGVKMFTVSWGEEAARALGSLYLFTSLSSRCQGSVVLSETTTYPHDHKATQWSYSDERRNSGSGGPRRTPTKATGRGRNTKR